MASFSAGTTFTDGVANDVTAAKLAALVNAATPTSGLIQDRTAETTIAADDTLLFGDFSDSNNLKRMTVANFNNVVTTGTGTAASPAIVPTGDTNTGIFFPAADTIAFSEGGAEAMRIDSSGLVGIGTTSPNGTLDVNGSAIVRGFGTSNTTITSHNGLALGTVAKNTSPTGGQGSFLIASNDASNRLEASVSLVSDATAANRRLAIGVIEQGVAWRNVTIAESGGDVGIGTASPAAKIHVQGAGTTSASYTNGDAVGQTLYLQDTGNLAGNGGQILFGASQGIFAGIKSSIVSGTGPAGNLIFQTRDTTGNVLDRMTVTREGLVGIGTASPACRLHLVAPDVQLRFTNGSSHVRHLAVVDADNSFRITRTGVADDVTIDSSGNVLVGTTAQGGGALITARSGTNRMAAFFDVNIASSSATPAITLQKFTNDSTTAQVFMHFAMNNGSTGAGQINGNGANAAAFGTYSDSRLKENITALPSQLDNVCALKPCEFDYKDGSGHQIGFIAQEMQQIYPDSVGVGNDGMLTITAWSKTEARLVKAIQELKAKNDSLEARLEALEAK